MFSDKNRDYQKNESRKNFSKDNPIEAELMKNKYRQINRDIFPKKQETLDKNKLVQRSSMSGSVGSVYNMNPTFEIFNTHTLVAKSNSAVSKSTIPKSRSGNIFQPHQPVIIVKPHYDSNSMILNSNTNPKLTRHPNSAQEERRSMSAVVKSQSKPEIIYKTSLKPVQSVGSKFHTRIMSATNKSNNAQNNVNKNYDSLSRSRNKIPSKISDQNNDPNLIYYSLPRKSKSQVQNEGKPTSRTKPIGALIDLSKKHKLFIETTATIATDISDSNPINFSSTLAKAATNSPPIKRRSSSLIHSPNPRMPSRFASNNTITDIYTTKNTKDYEEKYKKAAIEIYRENLALKFGPNSPFLSQPHVESAQSRSSTSSNSSSTSSTSTSSGTDQQISISSIPHDDIPLGIPGKIDIISNHKASPVVPNINESKQINYIVQDMVMFDDNIKKNADVVHLSDEENEYDDYNLDGDPSSSESYSSDSNEDIESLKEKFIPLHEIERLDDDFTIQNEMGGGLPDHQHSQSFRVENTSVASNTEVFVHKESLQRAKDALNINPNHGILSKQTLDNSENPKVKKRKAIFDPHILLLDACLEPDFELVKELVPKVPNISKKTIDGITALHNAVCSADPKLVLFLLQSGADVNASDADGWTPLHCAACCNNKQISKILVEHGASLFSITLSDFEIPSQKCNKASQEDTLCEEYLFWEQENLGVVNKGIVYALFKYDAQKEDELSLVPNQIIKILDTNPPGESGWFLAEDLSEIVNVPRKGFVAAAYVSVYQLIMPQKRPDLTHRS